MRVGGYSLIELVVATTTLIVVAGMTVPMVLSSVKYSRAAAAARYVAGRILIARSEAVKRSTFVALRFEKDDGRYRFTTYVDGNGNGVRNSEIGPNIDVPLTPSDRLEDHFAGVTFGLEDDLVATVAGESLADRNPIRIGRSEFLSFSPLGSATAGTLYIRGDGKHQFAVRVLGVTGRVSVLRFNFQTRRWSPP